MRELDLLQDRLKELGATNVERFDHRELHFDVNGLHFWVGNAYRSGTLIRAVTFYKGNSFGVTGFHEQIVDMIEKLK